MSVDIFAVVNRGLESICVAEMRTMPGLAVKHTAYRRVSAVLRGSLSSALRLRTADDVFIDLAAWQAIGPHRVVLAAINTHSRELDLPSAVEIIRQARVVSPQPSFSVTANFVGRRNYSMDEIEAAVAEGVGERYRWRYVDEDQSELNLRVFIEHDTAYVGLRLGQTSLHRRAYKQAHLPGSTKPPVAAAMLRVAELSPGMRLLDPACGAGTILIEGALAGAHALGGDIDPEALAAARKNIELSGGQVKLLRWDAVRLPLGDGTVDRVVANLPWGRQVQVDESLARFYRQTCAECQRVLAPGGQIVLLTSLPDLVQLEGMNRKEAIEISLFGQNPLILKYEAESG
jgi:tRNA (guanine6-N2)-methyltransferase